MPNHEPQEEDFSFNSYFVPFTTLKAIHWIIIIGLVIFANMLFNGFIWDDKTYILFNPDVQAFNVDNLIKTNIFNAGGQYRPIPAIYFAVLVSLFKNTTFFYHFLQLLIHIANTCLLFLVFTKFFGKTSSFFLSLLFLIHPIQVESVSYISASGNPLFFLFGILAVLLSFHKRISWKRASVIALLLLLSLLTKEAGIIFIFVVFFYKLLFIRRGIGTLFLAECVSLLLYLVIRFGIGGVYFTKLPLIPIAKIPFAERLLNIPAVIFYYLKTIFFPLKLAIDQQWVISTTTFQNFYFPLFLDTVFFICIVIIGFYIYKVNKENIKKYLFFLGWFIAGIFLYLQLFPLDGTVADRWFYFPFVGLLGIITVSIQSIRIISKSLQKAGYIFIVIMLVFLAVRTIVRNSNWSDPITLYTHDTQISDNFDIENNLGTEYSNIKDYPKAIEHSKKSVEMFPYEANLYNLANTYEQSKNIPEAKKYYAKALTYPTYLPINHNHFLVTYIRLAYMMYLSGEYNNAKQVINQGLQEYSTSGYLWIELAACEYKLGHQEEALQASEKAKVQLSNQQVEYFYNQITHNQLIQL
ncbi:MAG TPA: tetratricopeptide repeat protein [Candidatus Saccharimonadales bacterium]|nr:tetratricopeptide repeat protein [Candidatus Saccharimonadales bacterium]